MTFRWLPSRGNAGSTTWPAKCVVTLVALATLAAAWPAACEDAEIPRRPATARRGSARSTTSSPAPACAATNW